ncbi:MAG: polyprenyl synthetase family protein, partial [Planctomycetota bacterium]
LYAAALRCGAHLSGAAREHTEALGRFGLKMGCAFQITDDILDLVGEESQVGKSLGSDLAKAKMTLPLLRLMERASADQRRALRREIGHGDAARLRDRLLPLLEEHGAVESARETAEDLVRGARRELDGLPDAPERTLLSQAADYVFQRDR